jgi:hypothetical protein
MSAGGGGFRRRSGFTIAYHDPRPDQNPKDLTCDFPYQTLPYPVLAERIALVVLVWSGGALPIVTNLPIWVQACRRRPLPTFTTATGDWVILSI